MSQFESNLVPCGNATVPSRLVLVGNSKITKISLDELRNFIFRHCIALRTSKGKGRIFKLAICNVIVDAKLDTNLCLRVTESSTLTQGDVRVTKMNRRCLINVLFSDLIRPLLATHG